MDIQLTRNALATAPAPPPPEKKEMEVKPEAESVADVYDASRSFGNYVSGLVLGAATETVSSAVQSPRLAWEIAENLWQAETIGPNLKTLGTLAAMPAAGLSVVVAPFYGAFKGMSAAADHRRDGDTPLKQDASTAVARDLTSTSADGEPVTMTGKLVRDLEKMGARKLEPGEKPVDVPLLSPVFALTGGAVSGAIGGSVGLVAGLVAGTITGAKDISEALTSKELSIEARLGKILTSPLNLMVGPVLAWKSVKEAVPRGLSDGWKHGVFKPIADTVAISTSLGKSVIKEAWEK